MNKIDYFNLPWKDQWEWEKIKLPTVTAKYVENSKPMQQRTCSFLILHCTTVTATSECRGAMFMQGLKTTHAAL